MEVKTKTLEYEENFDFEMTWEDEVDIELDNILSDYNSAEALTKHLNEPMRNRAYMSCSQIMLT